jgi:hypothetical protein
MSETRDGGPAFPRAASTDEHGQPCNVYQDQQGMSLRDWFAGQAMVGLTAYNSKAAYYHAKEAYEIADAMIAQRGATP